jgi:hypothetical protein
MIPTWSFVFSEHKALRIAHSELLVLGENFSLRSLTFQLTGVSAGSMSCGLYLLVKTCW